MSKNKFRHSTATPQTHPDATPATVPREFRTPDPTHVSHTFACPDGPWKSAAMKWKRDLDRLPDSEPKHQYMRELAKHLATQGKDPSKADAIYKYFAGA